MRRLFIIVGLVVAIAAPASAQSRDRIVRTISEDFGRSGIQTVVFELDIGEVEISGADTDTLRAEVEVRCRRGRNREKCKDRAEDVTLSSRERGGKLYLEVTGTSLWRSRDIDVFVRLTLPEDMPTELDFGTGKLSIENLSGDIILEMSIGEATLTDVSGNITIDMGIGEVSVSMPQDAVGEVTLDNGIGKTELRHRDGRNAMEGILGGIDVHWDNGTGPSVVKIDLNVGEIRVRLR